jgi:hypothetical protein
MYAPLDGQARKISSLLPLASFHLYTLLASIMKIACLAPALMLLITRANNSFTRWLPRRSTSVYLINIYIKKSDE